MCRHTLHQWRVQNCPPPPHCRLTGRGPAVPRASRGYEAVYVHADRSRPIRAAARRLNSEGVLLVYARPITPFPDDAHLLDDMAARANVAGHFRAPPQSAPPSRAGPGFSTRRYAALSASQMEQRLSQVCLAGTATGTTSAVLVLQDPVTEVRHEARISLRREVWFKCLHHAGWMPQSELRSAGRWLRY